MLTTRLRRTGALLAATVALLAIAVPATAQAEWASIYIKDQLFDASGTIGPVSGVWEPPPSPSLGVEILRDGNVVATGTRTPVISMGDIIGYDTQTDFAIQPGDVLRVFDETTDVDRASVTYTGQPAVVACEGSATFTGVAPTVPSGGGLAISAHRTPSEFGGIPADGLMSGAIDTTSGQAFSGTFPEPLPDGHIVTANAWGLVGPETQLTVTVQRSAEELCGS